MMQQDTPEDFVVATGEAHSVREFVEKSFACVDRQVHTDTHSAPTQYVELSSHLGMNVDRLVFQCLLR